LDGGQEVSSKLIIAGGDASEVFQSTEAALDHITPFVGSFAEAMESHSVGLVRNDGRGAAVDDVCAKVVAVIPLVGDEGAHRRRERQQSRASGDVGILSGREMKCARSAIGVAQCVDFRGASSA